MKYIFILLVVLILCVIAGSALAALLNRIKKKKGKAPFHAVTTVILAAVFSILIVAALTFGYLGVYYHADPDAKAYLTGSYAVPVTKIEHGYFLDGPGTEEALIFYPGGKVEAESYAPMLYSLAMKGVDVFLMDMPLRMAIFAPNRADEVLSQYDYSEWLICGHSLGGMIAAGYYVDHMDSLDGLVLLAAYKIGDPYEGGKLLSLYGSEDKLLNREMYETDREFWPPDSTEVLLEGGNHCQFGNYGFQRGDGEATISRDEQQSQTVEEILNFME